MKALTYSEARAHLAETIQQVCDNHDPVIITKKKRNSVIMIALEDYESLLETSRLLRSSKNARRLLEAIKELEGGRGKERKLKE